MNRLLLDLVLRLTYILEDFTRWMYFNWESKLRQKIRQEQERKALK